MLPVNAAAPSRRPLTVYAWAAMLVFSVLPDVLWNELVGGDARWISLARLAILAVLVAAGLLLPALRPAWKFPAVLLAITIAGLITARLGTAPNLDGVLNWIELSQVRGLLTVQAAKFGVSILTIVALLALGYRRRDAFLTRGQIDAPAAPVRWLGFPTPEPWTSFGAKWVVFLSIGMVVVLAIFGRPSIRALAGAVSFIPVVLFLSISNAFNEEVVYRSGVLAPIVGALGIRNSHLLNAALFGIMHYYGVPYGVGGVILSTFSGWFLAKAMLETKGFFWSWLLHVVADTWIFYFILAGSIVPGG